MQIGKLCTFFFEQLVTECTDRRSTLNLLLCTRAIRNSVSDRAIRAARRRIVLTSACPFAMAIYLSDVHLCVELIASQPLPITAVVLIIDWMYAYVSHDDVRDSVAFRDLVSSIKDFETASEGQFVFAFPAAFDEWSDVPKPRHRGPLCKDTVAFLIPYICCNSKAASRIPDTISALTKTYDAEKARWIAFWKPTISRLNDMLVKDSTVRCAMLRNISPLLARATSETSTGSMTRSAI